jgi:hypothetical protein
MSTRLSANVQAHEKANKELAKAQSALEKAQHGMLHYSSDERFELMFRVHRRTEQGAAHWQGVPVRHQRASATTPGH